MALQEWDHFDIFHNSMPPIWSDWKWNSIMLSTPTLTTKSKKSHILIWRILQAVTQIFSVVVRAAMTVDSSILWLSRVPLNAWPASLQSHLRGRSSIYRHHPGTLSSRCRPAFPSVCKSPDGQQDEARQGRPVMAASHLRLAGHSACEFTNLPTSNIAAQPGACTFPRCTQAGRGLRSLLATLSG